MKALSLLIWLTQLGISVAAPVACSVLLAVWLRQRFDCGTWVIVIGAIIGVICAVDGLRASIKAMERMAKDNKQETRSTISFNEHD